MTDDFGLWEVNEATKESKRLDEAERTGMEALLEDILVRNPAMLMPGLELVGRQTPTANGYLDLLGIDSAGRLDENGWREHRDSIAGLVRLVDERWREAAGQPAP